MLVIGLLGKIKYLGTIFSNVIYAGIGLYKWLL